MTQLPATGSAVSVVFIDNFGVDSVTGHVRHYTKNAEGLDSMFVETPVGHVTRVRVRRVMGWELTTA